MPRMRFSSQNVLAGVITIGFGGIVGIVGSSYPIGVLSRMGPGYLPLALAVLMVLLGLVLIFEAGDEEFGTSDEEAAAFNIRWRPALAVFGGLISFGLLVAPFGLAPAIFALVAISSFAEQRSSWLGVIVLSIALCALIYLIFILGLGLSIPMLRVAL